MHYSYSTRGTCSSKITFDFDDGKVSNIVFYGGCNGNAKGISALVDGKDASEIIEKLKGIRCGGKTTSCPDQLAAALTIAQKQSASRKSDGE